MSVISPGASDVIRNLQVSINNGTIKLIHYLNDQNLWNLDSWDGEKWSRQYGVGEKRVTSWDNDGFKGKFFIHNHTFYETRYSIDNYVGDGSGKFLVDKIFRLEDINDCLLPFLKKLNLENLPQSIPFINKGSNNENIEEWYDSSSCKIIEKLFHYEIEHFNYRFKQ